MEGVRKFVYTKILTRSPEAPKLGPIRSLRYFTPVIEEVRSNPHSANYLEYLRRKLGGRKFGEDGQSS